MLSANCKLIKCRGLTCIINNLEHFSYILYKLLSPVKILKLVTNVKIICVYEL